MHKGDVRQPCLALFLVASCGLEHGALTSITGNIAPNAVTTVTTTRTVFESVILGQRTLADAMQHRAITTIRDAKAVFDLFALLVNFEAGFPVVEPGRRP